MKASKYASVIHIDNRHTIVFSAMQEKFVVFKNKILSKDFLWLEKIRNQQPSIFESLEEAGVIIEDDSIDETQQLKELIENTDNDVQTLLVNVNPTIDCNFKCWYCYEKHMDSKMSKSVMDSIVKWVIKKLDSSPNTTNLLLGFFGGEPLLYFEDTVKPLVSRIRHICKERDITFSLNFTSNGYLINDEIINFLKDIPTNFQITFDGGKKFHDITRFSKRGIGSFEKIVDNIRKLIDAHLYVNIRINYTEQNIDSVEEIADLFADVHKNNYQYFRFDFQRVWQQRQNKADDATSKADTIRSIFIEKGYSVSDNITTSVRYSCYGDKRNHYLINFNGDVFGCTARDFTKENRIGYLKDDGIMVFDEPNYSNRSNSKFLKKYCHDCKIAPMCGGGCKQRAYEAMNTPGCTYNYDDEDIENIILETFYRKICQKN